jgi:hypothetical protein
MSLELSVRELAVTDDLLGELEAGLRQGEHWQSFGECKSEDPEIFDYDYEAAVTVCGRCVVQAVCLIDALEKGELGLFRAGHHPDELAALARQKERARLASLEEQR